MKITVVIIVIVILLGFGYRAASRTEESAEVISPGATSTEPVSVSENYSTSSIPSLQNRMHRVTVETTLGTIVFETYDADAPKTVKNFVDLANKGFYNGVIFHRVIPGFMIQGGDPSGNGTGGPGYQFEDELNPATASYKEGYKRGVVAMANAGPNTNGSQFFIMQADYPLPNSYSIFGKVVSGQDVVDKIAATPRDRSDKPLTPVTMKKVSAEKIK
jgi:cyclophilin family peptidyl-prolyl cis-trans isomerase